MKHRPDAIQRHTHPRAAAFAQRCAQVLQQGFNVRPVDIRPGRLVENRPECAFMASHIIMIPPDDIIGKGERSVDFVPFAVRSRPGVELDGENGHHAAETVIGGDRREQ